MASSMTMPTISTRASMVTLLSVKPSAHIMPKAEMTEAGMATAAMIVERQLRMKASTTSEARMRAEHEVEVDLVQRRVDVARLVADDLELHVGGQLRREARQARLDRLDDGDRVLARLPPHLQDDASAPR